MVHLEGTIVGPQTESPTHQMAGLLEVKDEIEVEDHHPIHTYQQRFNCLDDIDVISMGLLLHGQS